MRTGVSSKRVPSKKTAKKPVRPIPAENEELKGPKKIQEKFRLFSVRLGLDMAFLFLVLALLIIGILMMFSAS